MTTDKVQTAFQALGIEPGASGQPGFQPGGRPLVEGEVRRTLCRTRVHAVRFPDGGAIVEAKSGMKLDWTAVDEKSGTRSLNYIAVEKWFSQHCQFIAKPSAGLEAEGVELEPSNEPKPYFTVEFIDKSVWEVYREGSVLFTVSDPSDRFTSEDLDQAIVELREIAGFESASRLTE
jgi:hypothetical protein